MNNLMRLSPDQVTTSEMLNPVVDAKPLLASVISVPIEKGNFVDKSDLCPRRSSEAWEHREGYAKTQCSRASYHLLLRGLFLPKSCFVNHETSRIDK